MRKYILIAILFTASLHSQSQTKWSLRQCIDYAIDNNISIKQEALSVESAKNDLSTSKNSRLPDLNASLSHQFRFGQYTNANTNISEMANASGTSFGIESTIPLFTGFKIPNSVKADELNLASAVEGLKKAKDNMELKVASFYLEVLFKKEILKANQVQVYLSEEQLNKTEIMVNSGKVAMSQLYDIKAQLAKDELNVTNAKNDLDLSLLDLAQVLNLNASEGFDIVDPTLNDVIQDNQASIAPVIQIYQTAIGIKPHVKEIEYKVESSRKLVKVAQSGYYPKLNLSLGYGTSSQRLYGVDNPSFNRQIKDNGSKYIGFSLSIPIFNRFQVRNQVRAARLQVENNELSLDNVKQVLLKEIQQAYQSAVAARSKYVSTEKAYEAADESYKYTKERYDVGKSNVFELSEAQTKLLTSKSEQIQAKYDFLFRAKILDFYSGKEIDIK